MKRQTDVGLDSDVLDVGMIVLDEQAQRLSRVQDPGIPVGRHNPSALDVRSAVPWVIDQRPLQNITLRQHEFTPMSAIEEAV